MSQRRNLEVADCIFSISSDRTSKKGFDRGETLLREHDTIPLDVFKEIWSTCV